jgi:hypothetical protein
MGRMNNYAPGVKDNLMSERKDASHLPNHQVRYYTDGGACVVLWCSKNEDGDQIEW